MNYCCNEQFQALPKKKPKTKRKQNVHEQHRYNQRKIKQIKSVERLNHTMVSLQDISSLEDDKAEENFLSTDEFADSQGTTDNNENAGDGKEPSAKKKQKFLTQTHLIRNIKISTTR